MAKDVVNHVAYDRFMRQAITGRLSRRELLQRASALGIGASLTTALLAACGDDDDDGEEPTAMAPSGGETAEAPAEDTEETTEETAESETDDETPEMAGETPEETEDEETEEPSGGEAPSGAAGGSLSLALNSDCTTMDPHLSTAAVDRQVFQLIYDKLVDIDEGSTLR